MGFNKEIVAWQQAHVNLELVQMQRWAARRSSHLHREWSDSFHPLIPARSTQTREGSSAGVHDASALKHDALRRFCGDGFLGSGTKPAHLPPIHAKWTLYSDRMESQSERSGCTLISSMSTRRMALRETSPVGRWASRTLGRPTCAPCSKCRWGVATGLLPRGCQ